MLIVAVTVLFSPAACFVPSGGEKAKAVEGASGIGLSIRVCRGDVIWSAA